MRSSVWNPPNRFDPIDIVWEEPPPPAKLKIIEDDTKGVLTHNNSPDVGFEWSCNPYRGCTHACAYCYARPSHEYLGFGAGSDFERQIVVKRRAPELLREAFMQKSWQGELVMFSGITDCYQPLERKYTVTRRCLEVCAEFRNPASIITRSPVITRDLDILGKLHEFGAISVTFSVPIPDPVIQRAIEPGAPPPAARFAAMKALFDAGIPVGVSISPIIPGLTDHLVPEALQIARENGARWAWCVPVRLPGAVATVFETRVREAYPDRGDRVMNSIRRMRGGSLYKPAFGERMRGTGHEWDSVMQMFHVWRDKLGYTSTPRPITPTPFRRPPTGGQLAMF